MSALKIQTRVDTEVEDNLLTNLITASRLAFERLTGRVLVTTTFREHVPGWGHPMIPQWQWRHGWHPLKLSRGPVSSVTSITYRDTEDAQQTLTGHITDLTGTPAMIRMQTANWPALSLQRARPITVQYVAGYGAASAVPADIKVALLSLCAHWFWNRESHADAELKPAPMSFVDFTTQYSTGMEGL